MIYDPINNDIVYKEQIMGSGNYDYTYPNPHISHFVEIDESSFILLGKDKYDGIRAYKYNETENDNIFYSYEKDTSFSDMTNYFSFNIETSILDTKVQNNEILIVTNNGLLSIDKQTGVLIDQSHEKIQDYYSSHIYDVEISDDGNSFYALGYNNNDIDIRKFDVIEQAGQMTGLNSTLIHTLTGDDFAQQIHFISPNEYLITGFSSYGFNGVQKFQISDNGTSSSLIERVSFNELTELPNSYYEFTNSILDEQGNLFIQLIDYDADSIFVLKYESETNNLSTVFDYQLQNNLQITGSESVLGLNNNDILIALATVNNDVSMNKTNALLLESQNK